MDLNSAPCRNPPAACLGDQLRLAAFSAHVARAAAGQAKQSQGAFKDNAQGGGQVLPQLIYVRHARVLPARALPSGAQRAGKKFLSVYSTLYAA